ncbi:MAG: Maf family protein [Spirochaetaceae bacterium]
MKAVQEPRILLGSSSPRRHELLKTLGLSFDVEHYNTDETVAPGTPPEVAVQELAQRKYLAIPEPERYDCVLTADTIVVAPGGRILGKPSDENEAAAFLRSLSGAPHSVLTGVCLAQPRAGTTQVQYDRTIVTVAALNEEDIAWYLSTQEWRGVAGGYRMQGAGAALLDSVNGSPSNVIGLPMRLVYSMFGACQFPFDRN